MKASACAVVLAAALAGCATPGEPQPTPPLPDAAEVGLSAGAATPGAAGQWWREFDDARLDRLIEQALAGQPNLQVAQARLAQARSLVAATGAATAPQIALNADVNWQRYTENGMFPPPIAGSVMNNGDLTLNGSLYLDFFGRQAAALRAALGSERASAAEVGAAQMLLAAGVARQYFGLARLEGWRAIAAREVALRTAQVSLTRDRIAAGLDPTSDLRSAESSSSQTTQQLEALDEQIGLARRMLAVYCGLAPRSLDTLVAKLPAPRAAELPRRLGIDLLGRRADVVAARWRVEAAAAAVDEARAAFYPDINLVGMVGFSAIGVTHLLALPNREYGIGPAIRLPIFDGGRLRAQQAGREAEVQAAVASYRGVVLDATREAVDAIGSMQSLGRQSAAQAAAIDGVERALELMRQRRRAGLASEQQLLAAEAPVLAQRRVAVDLLARRFETQAALMLALGGGWQPEPDAPPLLRPRAGAAPPAGTMDSSSTEGAPGAAAAARPN